MSTNGLIERLVADLRPVARGAAARRIAAGAAVGLGISAAMMLVLLGARPDLAAAVSTGVYWLKFGYALLLAACGFSAVNRLSRPTGDGIIPGIAAACVVTILAAVAVSAFAAAPEAARTELAFGKSALVCPWLISALAAPVLGGLFWAMRGLAPTRLPAAGLAAGLMSGAIGAWVYAFHCPESGIPFIAIWYTAGILVAGLAGLLLGSRLLRW